MRVGNSARRASDSIHIEFQKVDGGFTFDLASDVSGHSG